MNKRTSYYKSTIDEWITDKTASVLVVADGKTDSYIFKELGFKNVTISNLDERMSGDEFYPFTWSYQDAEALSFANDSFCPGSA